MAWFTIPTVLLVVTLCVSSAEETDILQVLYPQRTITSVRGSSVSLSCKVSYDFELCGLLHVVWSNVNNRSAELTDPSKYFTVVNETISDGMRLREVVTEILSLTAEDNAQFQCKAECETGEKAMGHFINIIVTD